MFKYPRLIMMPIVLSIAGTALAAVSSEDAKQLGGTLTLFGAEKAGNKDGSIPPYTGERIKPPATYNPKKPGIRPDPWDDKVLFSITTQNYMQYADKLSDGQKAMFKVYPNFRMDVYPTRRTAVYPKYVLDNTVKNATSCKGKDAKEESLLGCYGGLPFPIPKTGAQVMWNHLLRFVDHSWGGTFSAYTVTPKGDLLLQAINEGVWASELYDPARTGQATGETSYAKVRADASAPPRTAGQKFLFIQNLDQKNRAWQYIPGQRRVKLAPDLAYDTPNPQSAGVFTMDDGTLFMGALDRYDWKLMGKKELYIPYNAFKANNTEACPANVLYKPNFLNPDCVRFELHRVWIVEATLKAGFRHIYQRRVFYFDEDSPGAGMADNFDNAGKLYRVSYCYPLNYYEGYAISAQPFSVHDVQTGGYATAGFPINEGLHSTPVPPATYYSAEAMAGEGIR